eukprot:CAMPEP_0181176404 /NCGR_PEP_ID=MMETSP1096-20121128/4613_1 /TAXON_ID=156174 ORGANISM="Chrysochromulina ericina, Strain CCMP281" /NCGR_SAMPLE_ID=MMETSP1096 /ASSEMBLY_ACC=CAM_ASM_000453 /LENGTH=42 /DNA_ID= /DNA_START= /DNA_END= /DNA_ORIENTATION=
MDHALCSLCLIGIGVGMAMGARREAYPDSKLKLSSQLVCDCD